LIYVFIITLYRSETASVFADAGIPTSLIVDSAMGVAMETVDLCIVGAEGVMENGGIVNTVSEGGGDI
jgi:translation initiation factor eIF-2B subunit alpha